MDIADNSLLAVQFIHWSLWEEGIVFLFLLAEVARGEPINVRLLCSYDKHVSIFLESTFYTYRGELETLLVHNE